MSWAALFRLRQSLRSKATSPIGEKQVGRIPTLQHQETCGDSSTLSLLHRRAHSDSDLLDWIWPKSTHLFRPSLSHPRVDRIGAEFPISSYGACGISVEM